MEEKLDYNKWLDELDVNWKKQFNAFIKLEFARIEFRCVSQNREPNAEEQKILNLFDINNDIVSFKTEESFNFLIKQHSFTAPKNIKNLQPLILFKELERLDCRQSKISKEELEQFKKEHPNCEVIE